MLVDMLDQNDAVGGQASTSTRPAPWYLLDAVASERMGRAVLRLVQRNILKSGRLGAVRPYPLGSGDVGRMAHDADRAALAMLAGAGAAKFHDGNGYPREEWLLDGDALRMLLPHLLANGRFIYSDDEDRDPQPITRDESGAWELTLALEKQKGRYEIGCFLSRGETRRSLLDASLILEGSPGLCLMDGALADLETYGCPLDDIGAQLVEPIPVAARDVPRAAADLAALMSPPMLVLPGSHALTVERGIEPTGQIELTLDDSQVHAEVSYRYGETVVPGRRRSGVIVDAAGGRQIVRQAVRERMLHGELPAAGLEPSTYGREGFVAPMQRLPHIVRHLSQRGWTVLADGRLFRRPGEIDIRVTSGVDWFDVDGKVDFEGASARLPELLQALRAGQTYVRLDDGTLGMLPEQWLARHGVMLDMGRTEGKRLRFGRAQALMLEGLLNDAGKVRVDEAFAQMRERLHTFEGVAALRAPETFRGTLRPYQEHGLGWMRFLDEFGWNGCLADDMGLGKTVQVLAWLAQREDRKSSLAVVPKSVVFNWLDEARRFTPALRVTAYHGAGRQHMLNRLGEYDLVVTTYHTLRNDIADFAKQSFDYVILDEAQAVKNAKAQVAQAVRLLKSRRRLVLTGTPIENRLADLWSIFEFLNPGMLGTVNAFRSAFAEGEASNERMETLRRALRPFLLRRTKEAVAPELPSKTEETVVCEMTASQAKKYAELREYYRLRVLGQVDKIGLARSKIHVLEALLRLRQAACHPRLLDAKVSADDAGKIEALMPMLTEVIEGGHKALVFSQFTSFLAILRELLDKQKITYEYLDGQTHDRKRRVDRFQGDADCRLFLISLKAGGLGLNLTAADYVFILDPWWNPAAEAQAIDRSHRIGQEKKVIAYRMIAQGTVEEKIVALQAKKRDLAASIITQANSLISELTREDLEVLLS